MCEVRKSPLGGTCVSSGHCLPTNSVCSSQRVCTCASGFTQSGTGCGKSTLQLVIGHSTIFIFDMGATRRCRGKGTGAFAPVPPLDRPLLALLSNSIAAIPVLPFPFTHATFTAKCYHFQSFHFSRNYILLPSTSNICKL